MITIIRHMDGNNMTCACGCAEQPSGKKSNFCMGHDMRLRGKLIRAHLQGEHVEETVLRDGEVVRTGKGSAMAFAGTHGWKVYLEEAEVAFKAKCADLVRKAKKNPKLEKVGTTDEYPVMAVYVNANGSKDVEYIDKLGKKHWRHIKVKPATEPAPYRGGPK